MKSIREASVVLSILFTTSAFAVDKRVPQTAELDAIKAELKPLREQAALEKDVIAARKTLDAAYRAYWESVRVAMVRLDPGKKTLIEKEIALRKSLSSVRQPGEAKSPAKSSN